MQSATVAAPSDQKITPRLLPDTYTSAPTGLPAPLPRGEKMIWQGVPDWKSLARQIFHTRFVGIYFALLAAWSAFSAFDEGGSLGAVAISVALVVITGFLAVGLLLLLAWLQARSTVYTLTDKRILMRIGAAWSKTIDIPFKTIETVEMKAGLNGVGNFSISLKPGNGIPYMILWPHARPFRFRYPQPMLRAVPGAEKLAKELVARIQSAGASDSTADSVANSAVASAVDGIDGPSVDPVTETERLNQERQATAEDQGPPFISPVPLKIPTIGAVALIALTLLAVAFIRMDGTTGQATADRSPVLMQELSFATLEGDRISVTDAVSGDQVAMIEPNREGVVRGAVKGLLRSRRRRGLSETAPLQLVAWDTGRLTLSDLQTDKHIPIDSFGRPESGVLAEMLKLKDEAAAIQAAAALAAPSSAASSSASETGTAQPD